MLFEKRYNIVRYYFRGGNRIQRTNVTLEEAQKHCNDPKTKKEGKWFDGYVSA